MKRLDYGESLLGRSSTFINHPAFATTSPCVASAGFAIPGRPEFRLGRRKD